MKKETPLKPEQPEIRKPMEIARSSALEVRHLRFACSALYCSVQSFVRQQGLNGKALESMSDTAMEYAAVLQTIDDFYKKARVGFGDTRVFLVAESSGFTKQMEVSIKEKDESGGHWTAEWKDKLTLDK